MLPSKKDLTNALAWFAAPMYRFTQKNIETAQEIAEWFWVVIQGDFAEDEQSNAQIITGTVISLIPFVDQICDVRDLVANCKKIDEDQNNGWAWFSLILTLLGLFPELGSLFKGILKVIFAPIRRFMLSPAVKAMQFTGANLYKVAEPAIEDAITEFNKYLARPEVRKTLQKMKIVNVYQSTAEKLRSVKKLANQQVILKTLDALIGSLKQCIAYIDQYASHGVALKAKQLLQTVLKIRQLANQKLGQFLQPLNVFLEKLAQRIEREGDQVYQATTNVKNIHNFIRVGQDQELTSVLKQRPVWVDVVKEPKYLKLEKSPKIPKGYPDISDRSVNGALNSAFETFHDAKAVHLPEGTVLYRVLDPKSNDNSICWMPESEFKHLKSKADWRRYFAVFASWNNNGEYVTYKVPQGGINVWQGPAASQTFKDSQGNIAKIDAEGHKLALAGGGTQIVLDPTQLLRSNVSQRKATPWGYDSGLIGDQKVSMVGVPRLQQNWYGDQK